MSPASDAPHSPAPAGKSDFGPDLGEVFGPNAADGGPELVQLLTPEGERREHPEFSFDLDDEAIKGFYRDMVLTRRIDIEATALQRHGELGIWAQLLGQEAAQIGSGRALAKQDFVFPTYREHGVAYCKGIDPLKPAHRQRLTDVRKGLEELAEALAVSDLEVEWREPDMELLALVRSTVPAMRALMG